MTERSSYEPPILAGMRASIKEGDNCFTVQYWGLPRPDKNFLTLQDAVTEYNKVNGTAISWKEVRREAGVLDVNTKEIDEWVPSARTDDVYHVTGRLGSLRCECKGFGYRRTCWHVDAVEEHYGRGKKEGKDA